MLESEERDAPFLFPAVFGSNATLPDALRNAPNVNSISQKRHADSNTHNAAELSDRNHWSRNVQEAYVHIVSPCLANTGTVELALPW